MTFSRDRGQEEEIIEVSYNFFCQPKIVSRSACYCCEHAVCTVSLHLNLDTLYFRQQAFHQPDFFSPLNKAGSLCVPGGRAI